MYIQLYDSGNILNYLGGYLSCINSECTVVLIHKPAYSHCIQYKHWYIYILCFSLLVLSLRLFNRSCLPPLPSSRQVRHNHCSILPASSVITYSMLFFSGKLLVRDILSGYFVNRMCRVQKTLEILGIWVSSVENENWST